MFFYKYVKLVILASVLCIGYISAVNYTNQIKHNTKVSSAELDRQNAKVIRMQSEIASALASKAHKYRMVKIPISHNIVQKNQSEEGETRLASIRK